MASTPLKHGYTFTMPAAPWRVPQRPLTIAIIPARGGSKGIRHKNILTVAGKPLIAYTIEQALGCKDIDAVVVSTEDTAIARVSEEYGADVVMRPPELAGDTSPSEDALLHVLDNFQPPIDSDASTWEVMVMLQCTSPIRKSSDIASALLWVYEDLADTVLSAVAMPQFVWQADPEGGRAYAMNYNPVAMRPMRQQVSQYVENGSIYVSRVDRFRQTHTRLGGRIQIYKMPYWSRFEIDHPDDAALTEWIMESRLA